MNYLVLRSQFQHKHDIIYNVVDIVYNRTSQYVYITNLIRSGFRYIPETKKFNIIIIQYNTTDISLYYIENNMIQINPPNFMELQTYFTTYIVNNTLYIQIQNGLK